ncbi:MAG: hypothetical protein ACK5IC_06040 [Moheibacter sp.]
MKKLNSVIVSAIFIASAFSFYQCTNDEELFDGFETEPEFYSLQEVHESLTQNDTIEFSITDPTVDNELEGAQGVRVFFPANAFVDDEGNTITEGPLTVKLIEVFKRGDMIRHNIQTYASEDPLVSGGMFWLAVSDANGDEVAFSGTEATLPYQTDATGYEYAMQYFTGTTQTAPSGPVISWGVNQAEFLFDESAGENGEFTIWEILGGWSNCDAFYDLLTDGATQFSVKVTNVVDYTNTQIFFALDDFSTIASLNTVDGDALVTYTESIPVGATGKIIAISLVDGELQLASQDVTIAGDDVFELQVQSATIIDLESLLTSID